MTPPRRQLPPSIPGTRRRDLSPPDGCEIRKQAAGVPMETQSESIFPSRLVQIKGRPCLLVESILMTPRRLTSFLSRVRRSLDPWDCWIWQGRRNAWGYGTLRSELAHRLAYLHWVGPIPENQVLDPLCRNRACVNPAHLEAVSFQENALRGETLAASETQRTKCPYGHLYDAENTYTDPQGRRHCRTCVRGRVNAWYRQRGKAMREKRRG
jgi:hypothetical protein